MYCHSCILNLPVNYKYIEKISHHDNFDINFGYVN